MHFTPKSVRLTYNLISATEYDIEVFHTLTQDVHVRAYLMEGLEISRQECRDLIAKSEELRAATGVGCSHKTEAASERCGASSESFVHEGARKVWVSVTRLLFGRSRPSFKV